ncbi:MAG TPA: cyanophycinase [Pyrinomonadaceae bacterium]|jgi:cyanophycinase
MELSEARGKLVVIGGAEDREGDCIILKEFVRLAKGDKAHIVVMTVATDHPEEVGADYKKIFKRLGAADVKVVDVSQREDTESSKAMDAIEEATGLFFTGGDQLHITALLGGTEMDRIIKKRFGKGLVLGGTSAGAAMMSNSMMLGGESETNPRFGSVEIGPGMDFLMGTLIDTHFSQRGRHGRLITATAHYPQDMGIGIDEDTAMVVNRNEFEVIGSGAVTIIDAGGITHTNLHEIRKEEGIELHNIRVHILPRGARFSLTERKPLALEAAGQGR